MTNPQVIKVLVFGVCSAILSSHAAPGIEEDPHPSTFRVMTYNIWGVFNDRKSLEDGQAWVRSQTPDVVALQELTDTKRQNLKDIALTWGHEHSVLQKTSGYPVGITSRWPIETIKVQTEGMGHGYLHVKTKGINFIVVHLHPGQWRIRHRETEIILNQAKPHIDAGEQVIILGDFNAHSPEDKKLLDKTKVRDDMAASDKRHGHIENLREDKIDYEVLKRFFESGLIDSAQKHLLQKDRVSYPTGVWIQKLLPPPDKRQRIDFILCTPDLYKSIDRTVIPTAAKALNVASDHYPVITDFSTLLLRE